MSVYTVTIKNLYQNKTRVVRVEGSSPMLVHKEAYMHHMKNDEEISSIEDVGQNTVFTINSGFTQVTT